MTELTRCTVQSLFEREAALRKEADDILVKTGIGAILQESGFKPSGSYCMQTMTWRDLDFECIDEHPDPQRHWQLGTRLVNTGWVWQCTYLDAYNTPGNIPDEGLYWGVYVCNPDGGQPWKFDIWTATQDEFTRGSPRRDYWFKQLDDYTRSAILHIKTALCQTPEYGKTVLSVHIYEAVLEHGITGLDEFQRWWQTRYGIKENSFPA